MLRSIFAALCMACICATACIAGPAQIIGGTISGLSGSVTLSNNGTDSLSLSADGNFQFAKAANSYKVSVTAQPPGQICAVTGGEGVTAYDPIRSVLVACQTDPNSPQAGNGDSIDGVLYSVSGSITGLTGTVTLQLNADFVTVTTPASTFAFPQGLIDQASYSVTVSQQPFNQTCTFGSASGVIAGANVDSMLLTCVAGLRHISYSVNGSSGPVTVLNNGGDAHTSTIDGEYTFATALTDGAEFNVTVFNEPIGQACVIPSGFGVLSGTDISGIEVNCQSPRANYTISGIASGLTGNVVLNNAGIENISVTKAGIFTFPTPVTQAATYDVTIVSAPAGQACNMTTVSGSSITPGAKGQAYSNINTLHLNCATGYSVGGAVSGLAAGSTIRLINNSNPNDVVTVTGSTNYKFSQGLNSQSGFDVQVMTQPSNQKCTASAGAAGTIATGNVTTANIICTTSTVAQYTVGGNVSGLNGNITLSNVGVESIVVTSTGPSQSYTFPTAMVTAAPYNVAIVSAPSSVSCSIGANTGTISSRNITGIAVTCVPAGTIPVPVSGLSGTMSVENDHGATAVISSNGTTVMPGVFDLKADITLSVASSPSHQACVILKGSGSLSTGTLAPVVVCGPSRSFVNGQNANIVVGQVDFLSQNCNLGSSVSASSLCNPYGGALLGASGEFFASDSTNNRVLGFAGLPTTHGGNANLVVGQASFTGYDAATSATGLSQPSAITGNSNHVIIADTNNNRVLVYTPQLNTTQQAAAVVIGQASLTAPGVAACTATGLSGPQGVYITGHTLLIADSDNNRVLIYNTIPTTSNKAADLVIGQPNMTTCASNIGATTAASLTTPSGVWSDGSVVLIADSYNNRVLAYGSFPTSNNAAASLALGQQDLQRSAALTNTYSLIAPSAVTSTGMQVFVADTGNNRVVIWNSLPNIFDAGYSGQSFNSVLGQAYADTHYCNGEGDIVAPATLCTPTGVSVSGSHVIVTDTSNSRYVVYEGY